MKQGFYLFTIIFFLSVIYSCSDIVDVEEHTSISMPSAPDSLINKAKSFIISRMGEQFFNSYIKYDGSVYCPPDTFCIQNPANCLEFLQKARYQFVYRFRIPNEGFADQLIEFSVDTFGNVISEPYGIPQCSGNNCWDNFPLINKDSAISVARAYGLEKGVKDWEISFHYFGGDLKDYVWDITSTLFQSENNYSGKTFVINAHNGEIVWTGEWVAMQ